MFFRRIPIKSLNPQYGIDYVFYMQARRIEKMREKRKNDERWYSRAIGV
jgi:hypothetical protein